jgi:hypothetical protein
MSTRGAVWLALVVACGKAQGPAPTPPASASSTAETGPTCRALGGHDLEVCTQPAPADLDRKLVVTLRRGTDGAVLWTEIADSLAQAHMVGDQDPPMFQVVVVHHVEPTDDEDVEDAYYVIDLELVGGKVTEVNRFRDSGD